MTKYDFLAGLFRHCFFLYLTFVPAVSIIEYNYRTYRYSKLKLTFLTFFSIHKLGLLFLNRLNITELNRNRY
jgi:hypothetical protein